MAGTVTGVGAKVADLRPGEEVFGWCGRAGGFAEYARCPRNTVIRKPATMTFEQAASVPTSGVTALQALRDWAQVRPGHKVLINGASGGVGTFAVQIAKALGAQVTGVCSTRNLALVWSIGADAVIDYTREDFTRGARRYDVILDIPHFATHWLRDCRRALTPRGTLVPASSTRNRWIGGFSRVIPARVMAPFVSHRIRAPRASPQSGRSGCPHAAHRIREGHTGDRPDLPAGRGPCGHPLFRAGTRSGKIVITV